MTRIRLSLRMALTLAASVLSLNRAAAQQLPAGSAALACPAREGYVQVAGGRVWYQIVGSGKATPLLTLHGGPGFTHDYLEPIAALCKERPVVFYDQLGSGKSDRPADRSLWRVERFVAELGELRTALGLERVHILGQSWGTMLLTDYALTKPKGVRSMIMSDPVISVPEYMKDVARYRSELPESTRKTLERHEAMGWTGCPEYQAATFAWYKLHVCRLEPWPEPLERAFLGMNQEVYETMQGANEFTFTGNLKGYERVGRLKEIELPTLFICGRYDEASPRATELYHRALPGSQMVVFEKSAHLPLLEETDRYLSVVRDFLARADRSERH